MIHSSSLFSQVLKIVPRTKFQESVQELQADRGLKGFSCWDQFVSMLFCQLAQAKSLREICYGLRCCLGKLNHLGMKRAPKPSTLSYANAHRPPELYERTFYRLLERCRAVSPGKKKKFRFKNKLLSLDASLIELCVKLFDWAKFRQTKGAIKLHLLLDHEGYLPTYVHLTEGKVHEVKVAHSLQLPAESIVVMDRGYCDYQLFYKWTQEGVYFVTRLKENAVYEVIEEGPVPKHSNILKDQIIRFRGPQSQKKCPIELRRIVLWDAGKEEEIELLTNHMKFGASTMAAIYKDRWEIEIFFKTLKQNLKVKTFVGTTANALRIQIWTALIAILLLKYLKFRSRHGWAFSNLVAFLRWNLFIYRNLWQWIDNPFQEPPPPVSEQLKLPMWDSSEAQRGAKMI